MELSVNYLAIFLAAVASMVVGFVWYGPYVCGKEWMKLMGYTPKSIAKEQANMGKTYAISFILALVTAYVLLHVMAFTKSYMSDSFVSRAFSSSFWMWLGFVMPVQLTDVLFGSKKLRLFQINTGYQLASLIVMGIVLGYFV